MVRLFGIAGVMTLTVLVSVRQINAGDGGDAVFPDVVLNDSQWQTLPLGVRYAIADPAGRIWLQDNRRYAQWSLEELQAHIAEQFGRRIPQVCNACIGLLEPGGRVWFVSYQLHMLLGYDGETWITHSTVDTNNRVYGRCQTRGGLINADAHRYAGNAVWMRGLRGVYQFEKGEWSYQVMTEERVPYGKNVRLSVEPQGQLAVAWTPGNQDVWLFQGGEWTRHNVPVHTQLASLTQLVAESSRTLLFIDAERRIQRAVLQANGRLEIEQPKHGESVVFGNARASKVPNLYADEFGGIYVIAEASGRLDPEESGTSTTGGLIVSAADGKVHVLQSGREMINAFGRISGNLPPAILTQSGDSLWLPNRYGRGKPMQVDLASGTRRDEIPHAGFPSVHAVDRNGRVYVTSSESGSFSQPIMVWSPDGHTNPQLQVFSRDIGQGPVAVSGNGVVWATNPKGQLICLTAGRWYTLDERPFPKESSNRETRIESMIPGRDGLVLVQSGDQVASSCGRSARSCPIDRGGFCRTVSICFIRCWPPTSSGTSPVAARYRQQPRL